MTNTEKSQICNFRNTGQSYKTIATVLAINENTVKSYCSRNHLTDKDIAAALADKKGCCQQCGEVIVQEQKQKPRRFCCDACRTKWWNNHRQLKQHKNPHYIKCSGCGVNFVVYGSQSRKYCSHKCYLADRFKGDRI